MRKSAFDHAVYVVIIYTVSPTPTDRKVRTTDVRKISDRFRSLQKNRETLVQRINAPDTKEAKRTKVQDGDVLLSITADLGRTGVVKNLARSAYINQHLALIRIDHAKAIPEYLSAYLESPAGEIQFNKKNKGGTKAGLNFDDIRTVDVVLPPFEMQHTYRKKKQFFDQKIERSVKSIAAYESLFNSLMQRAFKSELTTPGSKAA